MKIKVRCFATLAEAEFLRDDVNALNRSGARPDPFSSFEFFEAFLSHDRPSRLGPGVDLWFLTAFDGDRLIGYMALKRVTHRVLCMRASKLDFLVTHDADRPHLVARPQDALAVSEAFYVYLLERRGEWDFLEFRQQDATSRLFPPPAAARLRGYAVRQWPSMDNGTIQVRWGTLEAYFRSFSRKFRSNVSRQMRSLLAAGEVEYLASSDPSTTPAFFELYRSIEQRSWKAQAGSAIGRHPQWIEYFEGLLDARQPMQVSIHLVLLNGLPVAGLITGAFEQGLYALHIAFDRSLSRLAPGSAVLLMGMRQAIDGHYGFFNLLSGFGYFKVRWLAQMSRTNNAQIYRIGTPFFWRRLSGDLGRWLFPQPEERGTSLFNPARRNVVGESGVEATAGERQRIDQLLVQARQGRCESLSTAQLAALMPFEARRPEEGATVPFPEDSTVRA